MVSAVIEPKAISSKPPFAKSSSAEPTAIEGSMKTATLEAASAKTASMATTTTAAASGRHSRLNQADTQCEQGYGHFPHHASSIGTSSFPKIRHFAQRDYSAIEGRSRSTDREQGRSIIDRIDIQLGHNHRRNALGHPHRLIGGALAETA
jgi:hypothetical protein